MIDQNDLTLLRKRLETKYIPEPNSGCWLWTGSVGGNGVYGVIRRPRPKKAFYFAHRVSYELYIGPVPDGLEIDHKCRVRLCINPTHLEAVTHIVNIRRSGNSKKTHCPQGHSYAEVGVYVRARGGRECRACIQIRSLARAAKRGEA